MEFYCSKNNLVNAVNIVSKAVPSKTTMTILECILIEATDERIKLTANDTESRFADFHDVVGDQAFAANLRCVNNQTTIIIL